MIEAGPQGAGVYSVLRGLVRRGDLPEAFFVETDEIAIPTLAILQEYGVRVPEDVGVVGYDDWDESARLDPPLTTVRTPRREIGRRAAEMLLEWPTDGPLPEDVFLPSVLIERCSTRPVGVALSAPGGGDGLEAGCGRKEQR